jgi:hypothetical protein
MSSAPPQNPGEPPAPPTHPDTPAQAGPTADDDGYKSALAGIQARFARMATAGPLFTTDSGDLFALFLDSLPQSLRQHYTCHACREFIRKYAGLVTITDGVATPVMWPPDADTGLLSNALRALHQAVARAPITGVFLSRDAVWGTPQTGPWHHFAVRPSAALLTQPTLLKTLGQLAADQREERSMLERGLAEFSIDVVRKAYTLLSSGQLARSDRHVGAARWLLELHERLAPAVGRARENLLWLAAAQAPAGFCHVRSGMLGTLLEDVAAERPFHQIKARFEEKMDPTQYMRPQAAPSAGQVAQAEKVVATLDAAGALLRRYARLDDVKEFVWRPQPAPAPSPSGGVFSHLLSQSRAPKLELPRQTLTFEKFRRTVLPGAVTIELQVPGSSGHFMALVTAAKPEAPPILQWDAEESRNPVSWYYHSGVDAEIRERVRAAGGMHEGVDIRASLLWNNRNDLDLHVITPRGEHIYYANKRSTCSGWLDVDMNVRGETTKPVENIRWARGAAQRGHYRVYVQNYRFHEPFQGPTAFKVELEIGGEVCHFEGETAAGRTGVASDVPVFEFHYDPAQQGGSLPRQATRAQHRSDAQQWNLVPGAWVPLCGITLSPNYWGSRPLEHHGRHAFFLIQGCRDLTADQNRGRGFFVESLRGEFHPIRATLEAFARTSAIAGAQEAEACGLGMSDQKQSWNAVLRVTTRDSVATYLIDRWE